MKKTTKNTSMGMALGMCFGISMGTALGSSLFHNISLGMCVGMAIGMCLGLAIGAAKDKEVNAQLQRKGYTVTSITGPDENNQYKVTIKGLDGEEQSLTIDQGPMDEEAFKIGDVVYLDEEGNLEQAYDEDEGE